VSPIDPPASPAPRIVLLWRQTGRPLLRAALTLGALALIALMLGPFQGLERRVGLSDVAAHAAGFAIITAALLLNLPRLGRLPAAGLALALGAAIEALQAGLGRSASLTDLTADLVGIALVALLWPGRRWM
jgi:VanZ family protein